MSGVLRIPATPGFRTLPAVGLVMALHALLLFSSARPTLLGSASADAAPAMTVRVLTIEPRAAQSPESAAAAVVSPPEATPLSTVDAVALSPVDTAPVDRPRSEGRAVGPASDDPSKRFKAAVDTTVPVPLPLAPPIHNRSIPSAALDVPATRPAGLPPAPAYMAGGKLDPGPRPLHDIEPVYPDEGNLRQGLVVLRLLINELGEVDNAAVVRAIPQGVFETPAIAAFSAARFSPGKLLGVAVKSQITIEVEFMPINRGARVSGRAY
jgi:TonB family protein